MDDAVRDRFMSKVSFDFASSCWLWTAPRNRHGYGYFSIRRRSYAAHRLAYEHFVGRIPDGLLIDHLCRVRSCVNPAHLEPVTNRENILRGEGVAAINARKVTCSRGHELTDDNVHPGVLATRGFRDCLTCRQLRRRNRST